MTPCRIALVAVILAATSVRADDLPFYPDKTKLLVWRDAAGQEHPIAKPADWAKRRAHILAGMEQAMGPLPGADRKVPLDVQVLEEVTGDGWVRKKISLAVEKGDRLPAYLFVPTKRAGKLPA